MVISKLDRMVSIVKGSHDLPYSSEPQLGLALLNEEGIRFAKSDKNPEQFMAWYADEPETTVHASNGLLAGCRLYIIKHLGDIK